MRKAETGKDMQLHISLLQHIIFVRRFRMKKLDKNWNQHTNTDPKQKTGYQPKALRYDGLRNFKT
jgi:hypothetical protein